MKPVEQILTAFGANPYRSSPGPFGFVVKSLQFIIASLELAAVLWVPLYAQRFANLRKPELLIIGAQKAGTTWIDRELRAQGLFSLPTEKETHHFDRGRSWTIGGYLKMFEQSSCPLVEVAPDYGPLPLWRIKAIGRLCPKLRVVFIAKNPATRLWSGLKMETGYDRGAGRGSTAFEQLNYIGLPRTRRYQDYAGQITRWRSVLGAENVKIYPFDKLRSDPQRCIQSIGDLVGVGSAGKIVNVSRAFKGSSWALGGNLAVCLNRAAGADIDKCEAFGQDFREMVRGWRRQPLEPSPAADRHLLYVCGFNPNSRATSSGQKLAFKKVSELARSYASVHVIAFRNRFDQLDPVETNWPENVSAEILDISMYDRVFGGLAYPLKPAFAAARLWRGRKAIKAHVSSSDHTDFYADFSQGLSAIPCKFWPLFTFRQHDVVSNLYFRRARRFGLRSAFFYLEARRVQRWETGAWNGVCRIETLSHSDKILIAKQTETPVSAIPERGTIEGGEPRAPTSGRIVFWGNMARIENEDAALHFIHNLFPQIKRDCPDAHIWIVGAHPSARLKGLACADITITGFVDDPAKILQTADLAVAPLRIGSGVKIKVFETIDLGIPTVVSPVGGEGIPDHPLLLRAKDDREFTQQVIGRLHHNVPAGYIARLDARNGNAGAQPTVTETFA